MKKVIITAVIIILLIGTVIFAYARKKQSPMAGGGPDMRGQQQQSVPVETTPVINSEIAKKIVITGAVSALAEVDVYPKQAGEVIKLMVDKGDKVKAGQILASVDSKTFELQTKQAQADLAGAKASYDKNSSLAFVNSETGFKQAKSNLDRLQSSLKQSEIELQLQIKQADLMIKKSKSDLQIAQAKLDIAVKGARDQELEPAKARVENAKKNLERLTALYEAAMVSQDQVETAQLQYDTYNAQYSLLKEGVRPEDIDVLKAQLESAKTSLESAQENKMLVDIKRSSMDSAKAQVDNALAAFEQAIVAKDTSTWEKDLAQADAAVKRAQASFDLAQQRLDESVIKAPINGTITQRFLDKGGMASTTKPFVNIANMDVVKITAKVPERELGSIKQGQKAIVKPDAYPDEEFTGKLVNISPIIDRTSQTCDIEVEVSNPNQRLKPGMFTRVELTVSENKVALVIPSDSFIKESEDNYVFVADNGKAIKKKVTLGISDGIKIEVISGLNLGEQLIIAGQSTLKDGMSVTLPGEKKEGKKGSPEIGKGKRPEDKKEGGK
ncbi:MAG: Efflux transporter periplasmic adaptor subunit [Candidatus Poribacteria bacterium]|nr:Efflux transporter periplasmic adaptor subunit [Candidatus Poribacteria bacterium]